MSTTLVGSVYHVMGFMLTIFFRSPTFRIITISILTIIIISAIITASLGLPSKIPNASVEEEIRVSVEEVGKLMELPLEKPTVATVSDVTKLPANQPFFLAAKNGDKVLFYNDAKKAILYRPETKKIITVGPIITNPPVK